MTPYSATGAWSDRLRHTLERYSDGLLRQVASKLVKPRSQWPVAELIDRAVDALDNAAVIDRRLHELDLPARRLLAFMGHSHQPRWKLGNLLELLGAVGNEQGPQPVFTL